MVGTRKQRRPARLIGRGGQLILSTLTGAGLALLVILLFHSQLRPALTRLAGVQVNNLVVGLVSETVREEMGSGGWGELLALEKDAEGRITALRTNMAEAEALRARVVDRLLDRLDALSAQELHIPLGSLTGSALLSGRGPEVPVRILSAGALSAELDSQFHSAGINQTRYQLTLAARVTVELLLPGGPAETEVSTRAAVAEAVLLGQVPERYADFSRSDTAKEAADGYFDDGTN